MRTVTIAQTLIGILARMGLDTVTPDANTVTQFTEYLNGSLRTVWERYPWPETQRHEQRQFYPSWDSGTAYDPGSIVLGSDWNYYIASRSIEAGLNPNFDPAQPFQLDYLVVGGGGGGGNNCWGSDESLGDPGAGGQVIVGSTTSTLGTAISVIVGNGGSGGGYVTPATAGSSSSLLNITALGGAAGLAWSGYAGGHTSGGTPGTDGTLAWDGQYYGGGGGGSNNGGAGGAGGRGGGGHGATADGSGAYSGDTSGTPGTGGGGGGNGFNETPGMGGTTGGSGIVKVKIPTQYLPYLSISGPHSISQVLDKTIISFTGSGSISQNTSFYTDGVIYWIPITAYAPTHWDVAKAYQPADFVWCIDGNIYVCATANTGIAPIGDLSGNWTLIPSTAPISENIGGVLWAISLDQLGRTPIGEVISVTLGDLRTGRARALPWELTDSGIVVRSWHPCNGVGYGGIPSSSGAPAATVWVEFTARPPSFTSADFVDPTKTLPYVMAEAVKYAACACAHRQVGAFDKATLMDQLAEEALNVEFDKIEMKQSRQGRFSVMSR